MRNSLVFLLTVGILILGFGCSGEGSPSATSSVKGKVMQGGRALKGGTLEFQKLDEPRWPTEGEIQADGTFTLAIVRDGKRIEGAAPGEYRVVVLFAKEGNEPPSPPVTLAKTYKIYPGENSLTLDVSPQ